MTTQAIIETIPKQVIQSSGNSDHEPKESLSTNTPPVLETQVVPESEPEVKEEMSPVVTMVEVQPEEEEPEDNDGDFLFLFGILFLIPQKLT